ncbi:hypothetical protein HMPREF3034_00069 [Prevotella sp. DNF00663]|nr:hypothetical protein HMPREF3034_00069 [Prevotella sp. DNF00663]
MGLYAPTYSNLPTIDGLFFGHGGFQLDLHHIIYKASLFPDEG